MDSSSRTNGVNDITEATDSCTLIVVSSRGQRLVRRPAHCTSTIRGLENSRDGVCILVGLGTLLGKILYGTLGVLGIMPRPVTR